MIMQRIKLLNWRNMEQAEILLEKRMFFLSPGGSSQSECLDVFRFLHDIVSEGGGMQSAIALRGGLARLRGHYDRSLPHIGITIDLQDEKTHGSWTYHLAFTQESRGYRRPVITREEVWKNSKPLLIRPDPADWEDGERLTQTALEQVCANREFRELVIYFDSISYLKPIPSKPISCNPIPCNPIPCSQHLQMRPCVRDGSTEPNTAPKTEAFADMLLCAFPGVVALTAPVIRENRLERISAIVGFLDPHIGNLHFEGEQPGHPLPNGSDGTLFIKPGHPLPEGSRGTLFIKDTAFHQANVSEGDLRWIVLLWWMLDNESLLLLEEPENYLDASALSKLPSVMRRLQLNRKTGRQILISTHSPDLLTDPALDIGEIITLQPSPDGFVVLTGMGIPDISHFLATGVILADDIAPGFMQS